MGRRDYEADVFSEGMDREKFKTYLKKKKLIDKSIKRIKDITQKYLHWLQSKNLKIEDTRYSDLMNYIGYLQESDLQTSTINDYIRCIGHYYDFRGLDNVTVGVRLLGETRSKHPLFNEEKLDEIYSSYSSKDVVRKIILGLIIYQGLDRNEVFRLKIDDLDLPNGKISIASSPRKNERVLDLKSHQILLFYDYIKENGLKNELFPSFGKENRIRKLLEELLLNLKKQSGDVINLRQLRYSCYAAWIKRFGVRKAQYLSGFKKPSSIQKYQNLDLEDLKGDILKFHPLG